MRQQQELAVVQAGLTWKNTSWLKQAWLGCISLAAQHPACLHLVSEHVHPPRVAVGALQQLAAGGRRGPGGRGGDGWPCCEPAHIQPQLPAQGLANTACIAKHRGVHRPDGGNEQAEEEHADDLHQNHHHVLHRRLRHHVSKPHLRTGRRDIQAQSAGGGQGGRREHATTGSRLRFHANGDGSVWY